MLFAFLAWSAFAPEVTGISSWEAQDWALFPFFCLLLPLLDSHINYGSPQVLVLQSRYVLYYNICYSDGS